jgi:RNA recognition motif
VAEHQRIDSIDDGDLVRITASGLVHLQLMANPEYLAACAEDTFVSDLAFASRVAGRITSKGLTGQFSRTTTAKNAWELVDYLKAHAEEKVGAPDLYLDAADAVELKTLREAEAAVGATDIEISKRLYVGNIPPRTTADELHAAFAQAGLAVAAVALPPRPSSNGTRWFAFVDMVDGRAAMEAIDSKDLICKGRQLLINEAFTLSEQVTQPRGRRIPSMDVTERIFVAGFPSSATEVTVRELFQSHGLNPVEVYLARDRATGRLRGYGFVSLTSQAEATQAIGALNGSLVEGRSLIVRPATPRGKDRSDAE